MNIHSHKDKQFHKHNCVNTTRGDKDETYWSSGNCGGAEQ
jgi:hypothetical protein